MNTLKQYCKNGLLLSVGLFTFIACTNSNSHNSIDAKKDITKYGDIREYILKAYYNDDHQIYVEAIVSNADKRRLFSQFNFENNLLKLKGRVEPSFVTENLNYLYYIIEDGEGPYGYIIYALEKSGNTLVIFEFFGN